MSSPLSESMEQILDRFDDAWNGPTPPRIEDFAPSADSPARLSMLVELFKIDMERRLKRGEKVTMDEYRQRFPTCGEALLDEAWKAAESAALPNKETDDPHILPTLDGPSIPPTTAIPRRIVGEYEVLGPLGSPGGMGEVYKARHRRLDKLVALKLLPSDLRFPREAAARFQREMKAVGALDHPNVVEAHDAGEQSGVIYLAMKLINGIDLLRLVKERGSLPIAEACELVRQAAVGLQYLHERGLVHRDVKPSNLMRTVEGTVKVLDLGLARWCVEVERAPCLTGKGWVMGTADFLAPEQVENAVNADARADIYGLGGTLFYLLTGHAPFADHKSQFSKLQAHLSAPPPDVRTLRPEAPEELAALIRRLLAKEPEERYQTAAEVAAALGSFVENAHPENVATSAWVTPPSVVPRGDNTNRRGTRKLAIGLTMGRWSCTVTVAIGVAVVAVIGLPVLWWIDSRPSERRSSNAQTEVASMKGIDPQKGKEVKTEMSKKALPPPPPTPNTKSLEPIHVMTLDVALKRHEKNRELPQGDIGEKVIPRWGDRVTVKASLTRPAYAFLIAFQANGKVEVCYPEKEDEKPQPTEKPGYPSTKNSAEEYELTDGEGLQAFAIVVSSEPLPSFKEWWAANGKGCPWRKEKALSEAVYRANGEDPVDEFLGGGNRGKGAKSKPKQLVADLAEWLHKIPKVETVQVLAFGVLPSEKR